MKLKKVEIIRAPRFPTQNAVLRDRSLLSVLPKRWQTNNVVLTAVSSLCAISLTACNVDKNSNGTSVLPSPSKVTDKIIVAPVFKHGSGYYEYDEFALSGITTTNNKIVTESQMEDNIIAESKLLGVNLTKKAVKVDHVLTPITKLNGTLENDVKKVEFRKPGSFDLDFISDKGDIGIEYVSYSDYADWNEKKKVNNDHLVFNPYVAANMLAEKGMINAKSDTVKAVGLLYDPGKSDQEEQIKLQVRDFINWLKGQGLV